MAGMGIVRTILVVVAGVLADQMEEMTLAEHTTCSSNSRRRVNGFDQYGRWKPDPTRSNIYGLGMSVGFGGWFSR